MTVSWKILLNRVHALSFESGQHNDSRMNTALIMTAVKHGAVVANHVEVTSLEKNADGKVCGASVQDNLTGDKWTVRAKVRYGQLF